MCRTLDLFVAWERADGLLDTTERGAVPEAPDPAAPPLNGPA